MSGTLYVVATPIGNLDDLTLRAARTLEQADFIAAEDTRVTLKILNHLNLKKPLVSYHEHNLALRGGEIIARMAAGESCALCCDAGTPAISDPGQVLVRQAHEAGIRVVPIPGPSAFVAALSAGGQDTGRFVFEGFLSTTKKQRLARLEALKAEERTIVLYEAPHKLRDTLRDLIAAFGADRGLTIAREISKVHEEIFMTTLGDALNLYGDGDKVRGEFVLLVAGGPQTTALKPAPALEDCVAAALLAMEEGARAADACREAAQGTPFSKSEVYKAVMERRDKGDA